MSIWSGIPHAAGTWPLLEDGKMGEIVLCKEISVERQLPSQELRPHGLIVAYFAAASPLGPPPIIATVFTCPIRLFMIPICTGLLSKFGAGISMRSEKYKLGGVLDIFFLQNLKTTQSFSSVRTMGFNLLLRKVYGLTYSWV
jgi:hypothetical protein